MPIRDDETLRSALRRHLGALAVIELPSSVLNEGTTGPARVEALADLARRVSAATSLVVTASDETIRAASASSEIAPDAYSLDRVPGGVIEISRALNAVLASVDSPLRAWVFWSSDEVGGLCFAAANALDALLEAVNGRYENGVAEKLARYDTDSNPTVHAGMR